ncbi:5-(carboxyamino)imidazole ribonucleotide synthase [Calothrix sp. 336/3]|uniref:5-(carboxyamino)imidazole ribonucleotide synthase n=1 Tax=Calothrix sp. 336/3 TaxID=1337936 RepID=UPI0004E2FF27|nr:5-(carboxyamino)imidazole ribonucleotide synthase [Calothrix sp. 336/3]AKG22078.1 phosphoribosylaminoimidazole carboxylase [Calothrix sp. 336/3]
MKRIGVIGGGQLAGMMGSAATKLGLELVIQTPNPGDPAVAIAQDTVFAAVDDASATDKLASLCDIITFENEFVDLPGLSALETSGVCFRPPLAALAPLLDKYHQRCYLQKLGLPVPSFQPLEAITTTENLTFPIVIKARRHGYDGQGTYIISHQAQWQDFANTSRRKNQDQKSLFLVEEYVPFVRELAIIAARSVNGEIITYPVVETQQQEQVCRRVIAPADVTPEIAREITEIAGILLDKLEFVGVLGIELFLTAEGKVLVNEIAPRTHNSGHFSLDGCHTSQFEQQLRAVSGLSLGNPGLTFPGAVMVNLLGYETSESDYSHQRQQIAQIPQAYVHWYEKKTSRPGRKLGHVTVLLDEPNRETALAIARKIESIWYPHSS